MNIRHLGLIVCLNLAQLPIAMRPLLITLVGAQQNGDFAVAGLAGGAAAAGMALSAPWWSRALPRFGDRQVLIASGVLFLGVQLALTLNQGPALLVGLAGVSGLCTPPISSSVRAMLPRLTHLQPSRAYAINAITIETVYLAGPLWVTGWAATAGPTAALAISAVAGGAMLAIGSFLAPSSPSRSRTAGPPLLAMAAVRTLAGSYLAYWVCMGAMWVLLPAYAHHIGASHQTGLLVTLWSAGSLAGGLVLMLRPPHGPQRARYLWLLAIMAATSLPLTLPTTVGAMAVAITVFGSALAPWLATNDQLAGHVGRQRSAELYGWLTTIGQIGSAAGSTLAGPLGDRYGGGPAFLLVTTALATALAIALCRKRTLPPGAAE
jgi:MFS family permease